MKKNYDEMGPIHPWLPDAMKLKLHLEGDQVIASEVEFGYLSRKIEQKAVGKTFDKAQKLLSRVEPESAAMIDQMLCECVENALKVTLPARARWAREIAKKITEMSALLRYLTMMSRRMGLGVLSHIILKHREELLDLFELLSGSRYGYFYTVLGGVRYPVTDGFIERVENWVEHFKKDFARIEAMFFWTYFFQNRLQAIGKVIHTEGNAFMIQSSVETTRVGMVSNVESRLSYALQSLSAEAGALVELVNVDYQDSFFEKIDFERFKALNPDQIHENGVETRRGSWGVKMKIDQDSVLQEVTFQTPSDQMIQSIAPSLEFESYDDIPVILQSLNFLVTEVDR